MALERADIIEAAIAILDEEGLEAVSTRKIAARLGISSPSLYWHFTNKRELIDHMAEYIMAETMPSPDPVAHKGSWQTWLAEGARAIRRAALSHRDGARVIAGSRPTGRHPSLSLAAMITRLQFAGFSRGEAVRAMTLLANYALGWALSEQAHDTTRRDNVTFELGLEGLVAAIETKMASGQRRKKMRA